MERPITEAELKQQRQIDWKKILEPVQVEGSTFLVVPDDFDIKNVTKEIEEHEDRASNIFESVKVSNVKSFAAYVNKYCQEDTLVSIDTGDRPTVQALIDYHSLSDVKLCKHRVNFSPRLSKDWLVWTKRNTYKMSQYEFALFVEDQVDVISDPSGAEMLDIATKFKVIRKAHFSKGVNLNSGEIQFTFNSANEKGTIEVPAEFKIVVQVFEYGEHYELTARLRYRLTDDELIMWYELKRPDLALDKAIESLDAGICKSLDKRVTIIWGEHLR